MSRVRNARWVAAVAIAVVGASQAWAQQGTVEERAAAQQQRSANQALQLNQRSDPSQPAAQRGTQQSQAQQSQMTRQQGEASGVDAKLAAWLIADNRNEVEINRFAQQQTDNNEIRQFAQRMVTDHTQFLQQLQQVAGPAGAQSSAMSRTQTGANQAQRQPDQQQTAQQQPGQQSSPQLGGQAIQQRTGQQMAGSQAGGEERLDIVQLKQQLADKKLESTRRELEEKDGREFNQCFAFQQVAAHLEMLDTLQVFKQHASPELSRILDEGIRTTEQHLAHAKQLAERIDQQASSERTQARVNQ